MVDSYKEFVESAGGVLVSCRELDMGRHILVIEYHGESDIAIVSNAGELSLFMNDMEKERVARGA